MNLQNELKKWADETADFYHQIATTRYNRAFHTQSNLSKIKKSPELLILAINPNADDTYLGEENNPKLGQINNAEWVKWGVNGRMNGETLLKGNPWWKTRNIGRGWGFWNRLSDILNQGDMLDILQDDERFVSSNLTFFVTKNEKEIPRGILEECAPKAVELINILKPTKAILCLGGSCINALSNSAGFEVKPLLDFGLLSFGVYNGKPVYSVKHPRTWYTREEMNLVGRCLRFLIENSNRIISTDEIQEKFAVEIQAVKDRKSNKAQNIIDTLRNEAFMQEKHYEDTGKSLRFKAGNFGITVTADQNGYVAIEKRAENAYNKETVLEEMKFQKINNRWLGVKFFKDVSAENEEELANEVKKDITALIDKLNK